jgi:hemoglobin
MFRKIILTIVVLIITLSSNVSTAQETLYKRLGGYDAICAVVDDFITGLATNKDLEKFFKGASVDSQKKIRQHVVDLICEKSGGPCYYIGRSMKQSHQGLGITEHEWNTAAGILVASLNKFHVPQAEMDELLAIVSSTKADIVEKP